MKKEQLKIKGLCFGEVLWDNLPNGKKLGGAPLNVAYHLNQLGVHTQIISCVGDDGPGNELIASCQELGVPTRLIATDQLHPTSSVEVHIDAVNDVTYDIVFPVAWDFIENTEAQVYAVQSADFLVFGSLCARNEVSFVTLKELLTIAKYKVLDVNLRAPHYSKERVLELLEYANLVKMNKEELIVIARWLGLPTSHTDSRLVDEIMERCGVDEVIVTYGAGGAVYHARLAKVRYHFPALSVTVKDTVGSGDSFLAAFLSARMGGREDLAIEDMMGFAATLSAFVTQSDGGCPHYDAKTINRFEWIHYLAKGEVS